MMKKDSLYEILGQLVDKPAKPGKSVGITLLFESSQIPGFYLDIFEFYADMLQASAVREGVMVVGPDKFNEGRVSSLTCMKCSANLDFHEGFRFAVHPSGSDGWASLQYTADNAESALIFLDNVLPELGILEMAVESRYNVVSPPSYPSIDAVEEHFRDYSPAFRRKSSGRLSPVSRGIILAFYQKGWNLYEYDKDHKKMRNLAAKGPVKVLRQKKDYLIRPVAGKNDDIQSIDTETALMERLKIGPKFISAKDIPIVALRPMKAHFELVTGKGVEHNIILDYWGLRDKLLMHISPYKVKR
jgi:hypothetical protein